MIGRKGHSGSNGQERERGDSKFAGSNNQQGSLYEKSIYLPTTTNVLLLLS